MIPAEKCEAEVGLQCPASFCSYICFNALPASSVFSAIPQRKPSDLGADMDISEIIPGLFLHSLLLT